MVKEPMQAGTLPLQGRVAVVTGVSSRVGIGFAAASRLAALGADLFIHSFIPFDADQPWGADADGIHPLNALASPGFQAIWRHEHPPRHRDPTHFSR